MNLGIIGFGNIGEMIFENLIDVDFNKENKIYLSNKSESKLKHINDVDSSICVCKNNKDLAKNCEIIIISVKSPQLLEVIKEIKPYLNENTHIVHTCAGVDFEEIKNIYQGPVSCVIPTIASTVVENKKQTGISIFYHPENVSENQIRKVEEIFSKFSYIKKVDNLKDLEDITITTSCMPAFIAQLVLIFSNKIAENSNIPASEFKKLLTETINSTANILNLDTFTEAEIIDKVATKNGITQKGLDYLESVEPNIFMNLINKLV